MAVLGCEIDAAEKREFRFTKQMCPAPARGFSIYAPSPGGVGLHRPGGACRPADLRERKVQGSATVDCRRQTIQSGDFKNGVISAAPYFCYG